MNSEVDLTQWDDEYTGAEIKESDFDDAPDGKYVVNIDRAELTTSKKSGNPMLKWTLQILSGEFKGRLLWRYNVLLTPENMSWLKGDLFKCGLTIDKLSDLQANLSKLLDIQIEINKKTKGEYANIYFGKRVIVGDVSPAKEYDENGDEIPF